VGNFRFPGAQGQIRKAIHDDGLALRRPTDAPVLTDADQALLAKVKRMKWLARQLKFTHAVEALDHYLDGSGTFVEIPDAKVRRTRAEAESRHQDQFTGLIRAPLGVGTVFALRQLTDASGKAKPPDHWPARATVEMEFTSGVARAGVDDDNLTYYGSQIHSVVTVEFTRDAQGRTYTCRITRWRSWVVDNYDWEGEKQFGGKIGHLILPSQGEMRHLAAIGKAKPYQRSSRSWEAAVPAATWTESFETDHLVEEYARVRKEKIERAEKDRQAEAAGGALPVPGPAEEMAGTK
jgi:hypothetical protein